MSAYSATHLTQKIVISHIFTEPAKSCQQNVQKNIYIALVYIYTYTCTGNEHTPVAIN